MKFIERDSGIGKESSSKHVQHKGVIERAEIPRIIITI